MSNIIKRIYKKIRWQWWRIRAAFDRAFRGYDNYVLYDISELTPVIIEALRYHKKNTFILFNDPETGETLTEEEHNRVVDKMIAGFESLEKIKHAEIDWEKYDEHREIRKEGLKLFGKYYNQIVIM